MIICIISGFLSFAIHNPSLQFTKNLFFTR